MQELSEKEQATLGVLFNAGIEDDAETFDDILAGLAETEPETHRNVLNTLFRISTFLDNWRERSGHPTRFIVTGIKPHKYEVAYEGDKTCTHCGEGYDHPVHTAE